MLYRHLLLLVAACTGWAASPTPRDPAPAQILAQMEKVADWQWDHPAKWKPHQWHNAAYYAGVMALADVSASPRFIERMIQIGETNHWRLGPRTYHADDHAVGQTYVDLYLRKHDDRMIRSMREQFDLILSRPREGSLEMNRNSNPDVLDRWSWCDALFMAPPAWIRLWAATGQQAYLDFAVSQWWTTSDYLYDQSEHLYFRDSGYFSAKESNGRKIFWSRGNGWVMAGLVRMLQLLPASHPARPRFEMQFREMSARIVECQQPDGFWRASLLDPTSYPMQETSGTGFFCYALAWGVNAGLLDGGRFTPAAVKAWQALTTCLTPEGKLTHVQPVGAAAHSFAADSTEPYGVGAFLLAGSEIYRLQR